LAKNGSFLSLSAFGLYFFQSADNLIKIFLNSLCRITLLPPPLPPPPIMEWNHPLMTHLDTETVLPQDPGNSMQIDNSRINIESEGGPSTEVNYLSENPSMPQLVSAAPSLDDPNQSYLGTLMDDENREKLLE
jgi:hypothetical protein